MRRIPMLAIVLALLPAVTLRAQTVHSGPDTLYPDATLTPGEVFSDATADVVCVDGYARAVRHVPQSEREAVFAAYGPTPDGSPYELDHLIPLEPYDLPSACAAGNVVCASASGSADVPDGFHPWCGQRPRPDSVQRRPVQPQRRAWHIFGSWRRRSVHWAERDSSRIGCKLLDLCLFRLCGCGKDATPSGYWRAE